MSLKLTLKKLPFEIMVSGEKKIEYRTPSQWIESRLYDKENKKRKYNFVEFTNGYGKNRPYFKALYNGFYISDNINKIYSNGLEIMYTDPIYCIKIGRIIEIKNYR